MPRCSGVGVEGWRGLVCGAESCAQLGCSSVGTARDPLLFPQGDQDTGQPVNYDSAPWGQRGVKSLSLGRAG